VHRFFTAINAHRRGITRLVPIRANGQPTFGEYVCDPPTGGRHVTGVLAVGIAGDRICEVTQFETTLAP
jgi:RNA polymerase sigma-70 factor (ECF subfamily)